MRNIDEYVYFGQESADGKMSGEGTMIYKNGTTYTGIFLDGVPTGRGIKMFREGMYYIGDFVDASMAGKGY